MCQSSCGWDSPISGEILPRWQQWLPSIPKLESIKLNHCFKSSLPIKRAELHHFSDAANMCYGQCSYLRVIDTNDNIMCSLVMAKSRVTPLKVVSIPRLELAAAVMSCKVSKLLNAEVCIDDLRNIYCCDSQIVLAYISNEAKRFHVYVANRVQTIRSYSSVDSWRYVPTEVNPADDSSRGINIDKLVDSNDCRWLKGPAFLYQKDIPDFLLRHASLDKSELELRAVCFVPTAEYATDLLDRLSYFSSWFKAKRAVVNSILIIQFWHAKCKNKIAKLPECTVHDLQRAEILMIKAVQVSHFKDEVSFLKGGTIVHCNSKLFGLCPIIGDNGVMWVGG